jgi:hypothetical protein
MFKNNYKEKYLKYKEKYLNEKKKNSKINMKGGNNTIFFDLFDDNEIAKNTIYFKIFNNKLCAGIKKNNKLLFAIQYDTLHFYTFDIDYEKIQKLDVICINDIYCLITYNLLNDDTNKLYFDSLNSSGQKLNYSDDFNELLNNNPRIMTLKKTSSIDAINFFAINEKEGKLAIDLYNVSNDIINKDESYDIVFNTTINFSNSFFSTKIPEIFVSIDIDIFVYLINDNVFILDNTKNKKINIKNSNIIKNIIVIDKKILVFYNSNDIYYYDIFNIDGNLIETVKKENNTSNIMTDNFYGINDDYDIIILKTKNTFEHFYYPNTYNLQIDITEYNNLLNANYNLYRLQEITDIYYKNNHETTFIYEFNIFDMLYLNRNTFNNTSKPEFKFLNLDNFKRDTAIDAGGLTKTVFEILGNYLMKSNKQINDFFEIDDDIKTFGLKQYIKNDTLYINKINFLGKLFGYALIYKQLIYVELDLFLLYLMINKNFNELTIQKMENIINNFDVNYFNYRPYKCLEKDNWNIDNTCKYNVDGDETLVDNRKQETLNKIINKYEENKTVYDAFIGGFNDIVDVEKLKLNYLPLKLLNKLFIGDNDLTLEKFLNNLHFTDFNDDEKSFIISIITIHSKEKNYLETLLKSISSYTRIPIGGFPQTYPLTIKKINNSNSSISFHTCFNYVEINYVFLTESMATNNIQDSLLFNELSLVSLQKSVNVFSSA